jgi:hypothetical protein
MSNIVQFPRVQQLTTYRNFRRVCFVAFIHYCLRGRRAESRLVRIFWRIAIPVNYFFTNLYPHRPLRFLRIPRNFHSIWFHRFLPLKSRRHYNPATSFLGAGDALLAIVHQIGTPIFPVSPLRNFFQFPEAPAFGNTRHFVAIISNERRLTPRFPVAAAPTFVRHFGAREKKLRRWTLALARASPFPQNRADLSRTRRFRRKCKCPPFPHLPRPSK